MIQYGYDVFGDLRKVTDALTHVTTNAYDKAGRLTQVVHPGRAAGSFGNPSTSLVQLTDTYDYDGLGQRIRHWNSQFGNTVIERTAYDRDGRITGTTDFEGRSTTYAWTWDATLATTGLGTFGGWTKTTTTVAAKTSVETLDHFGRVVGRTDLGGRVYSMTFDKAGRLTAQTSTAGQSLAYGWYNTGWMAELKDVSGNEYAYSTANTQANYDYDAGGNRTRERYVSTHYTYEYDPNTYDPYGSYTPPTMVQVDTTHQDATATYDALGRMVSYDDAGTGGSTAVAVDWEYDQNGNVRHMVAAWY